MRNLIVFLWRNNFFVLFVLLEVASVYLLVQHNTFQRASFINSANEVAGTIYKTDADVREYLDLKDENARLATENAYLRNKLLSSYMTIPTGEFTVKDTIYRQQYVYTNAKVVNNSTQQQNNYITLNKGDSQGIRRDMAVITGHGIVGVVTHTSANYCTVMSILHRNSVVNSRLKKDGSFGPMSWDGKDYRYVQLKDIPTHAKMKPGDTVVTSSYSATFPEGIPVGTVESYEQLPGEYFYTVKVRLIADLKKVNYVYVVQNILKQEQDSLEKNTQKPAQQ